MMRCTRLLFLSIRQDQWLTNVWSLGNSLHHRPFLRMMPPLQVSHFAVLSPTPTHTETLKHLGQLCRTFSVPEPNPNSREFQADMSSMILVWTGHREFSTFTFIRAPSEAKIPDTEIFSESPLKMLPSTWISSLPYKVVTGVHITVVAEERDASLRTQRDSISRMFNGNYIIGSEAHSGKCRIYTDMRLGHDGFMRVLVSNGGQRGSMNGFQTGRLLQRLLDLETYRMMAMLAIPVSKNVEMELDGIRSNLQQVMSSLDAFKSGDQNAKPRELLNQLCHISSQTETMYADTIFRFRSTEQYNKMVQDALMNLRLERIAGLQGLDEFLLRRFEPQMRTCRSVASSLLEQSEQNARSVQLLQAYVSVGIQEQNQQSLETMNSTAQLQLRLQHAVEGLSVIALSYYLCGLISYVAKAMNYSGWLPISPEVIVGACVPIMVLVMRLGLAKIRRLHH